MVLVTSHQLFDRLLFPLALDIMPSRTHTPSRILRQCIRSIPGTFFELSPTSYLDVQLTDTLSLTFFRGACHYLTNRFQMEAPVAPSRSLQEGSAKPSRSLQGATTNPSRRFTNPSRRLHIPKAPRRRLGGFTRRPPRRVRG